jgi:hypothetical protein
MPAVAALFMDYGPTGFAGPGDVVSGAVNFFGVRSYSLAKIGTNTLRLRAPDTTTGGIFTTVAGGGLDLSGINAFIAAHPGGGSTSLTDWYDQTGSGTSVTTSGTLTTEPLYLTAPAVSFDATRNLGAVGTPAVSALFPVTIHAVATVTNAGNYRSLVGGIAGVIAFRVDQTTAVLNLLSSGTASVGVSTGTVPLNTLCSIAVTYDSSHNFVFYINGVSAGSGSNTVAFTAGNFTVGQDASSFGWLGNMYEIGWWNSALSATQIANLTANARSYYGF